MIITFPSIDCTIDTTDCAAELIIENPKALLSILESISFQIDGNDGKVVLSKNNSIVPISKNLELLTVFSPFEINRKNLANRLVSRLIEESVSENMYESTIELRNQIEEFCLNLSSELIGSIEFRNCTIEMLIRGMSPYFEDSHGLLIEKLSDYFDLVREYERDKLFVLYNLRSLISDADFRALVADVNKKSIEVVFIESLERANVEGIKRIIVDIDLCMI